MKGVAGLISVIMLTYNRQNFIRRAIESVLVQTFRDYEFVIVDNGSTDSSGKIAEEYAGASKVRVIHRERGTIGSGRNSGLEHSAGEWVTFIDDDDFIENDYLEFLLALAVENSADIAICGTNYLSRDEKRIFGAEDSIIELLWRKRFNNGFPAKLFKRTLFDHLRFSNTEQYEDVFLMYRVLANANRIVYHGLPKYNVTRHLGNHSAASAIDGKITAQYIGDYRRIYRDRNLWLCRKYPGNSEYWRYFNWSFQLSMVRKIIDNSLTDCEKHLTEMSRELLLHKDEFLNSPYMQDYEKLWMERYILYGMDR